MTDVRGMHTRTLSPGRNFSVGFGLFQGSNGQRIALPFRRSIKVILVVAAVAIVMTIPAVSAFTDAAREWSELESLFDLTSALFMSGWLLGWSAGLFIVYAALALVALGGETLVLRPGTVEIRMGLPFLFMKVELDAEAIGNLRHWVPKPNSGKAWRGPCLAFEHHGFDVELGSDISPAYANQLAQQIRSVRPRASWEHGRDAASARTLQSPPRMPEPVDKEPFVASTGTGTWDLSMLALLGANLVPLVGVLLLGWDLGALMVLFWAESGIIGFYNLCKMAVVQGWLVLFTGLFFLGHFGGFMSIHFLFIYEIFVKKADGTAASLAEVGQYFYPLWPALLALLLSHGLSFFVNFLGRQEYRNKSAREQMQEPYGRVVIMHLTVIFGGGMAMVLGSPVPALLLLVVLKILADIRAHRKQRRA